MTGKRANQGSDRLVPDFINGIGQKRTTHHRLKSIFVRCYSNSGQTQAQLDCPLCANSRHRTLGLI